MRKIEFLCLALAALLACLLQVAKTEDRSGDYVRTNAVESLAETEKWMKKSVNSGVKMALPYLLSKATEIKMNTSCMRGLLKLLRGIMNLKDWAIRMLDALGKPSAGLLEGTSTAMGDYDECLEIAVPKNTLSSPPPPYSNKDLDFQGKYCMVQIHLPESIIKAAMDYQKGNRSSSELANSKTFLRNFVKIAPRADIADLRFGVCIPSTCETSDLQAIIDDIAGMIQIKATTMRCEIKEKIAYEPGQIVILLGMGLIAALVMAGTMTEMVIRLKQDENIDDINYKRGIIIQSALAFSAANNLRQLFSLKSDKSYRISCIRGLKFFSVCLYILVWTYANNEDHHFLKYKSAFHFFKFMQQWWFTAFANASAGIDTLYFIAGLQVTYILWKKYEGRRVQISIPKFILKWYSRFALIQIVVISLVLYLPAAGSGPMWAEIVNPVVKNCKERWWLNIFALNNFWPSAVTCLPHTWLLCSLMHLLILASVVLFILSKWTAVGIFVNIILILGSCFAVAMVTLMNELPPAPAFYFLSFLNMKTIWDKLFIQAYNHAAPFFLGIIMGYFFNRYPNIQLRRITVAIGWCSAIILNLTVMCGLYGYRHGETMGLLLSAIYASVHRLAWSLGIAWMVFACSYGYGGFVDKILSWKLLIPLEKLTILLYLLHPFSNYLHEGQLRERMYMGHIDQAMYATAYIVFTTVFSILCYITCVAPFLFFEQKLWRYFGNEKTLEIFQEKPKLKRKDSKPTILNISSAIEKSKVLKERMAKCMETKTFQI